MLRPTRYHRFQIESDAWTMVKTGESSRKRGLVSKSQYQGRQKRHRFELEQKPLGQDQKKGHCSEKGPNSEGTVCHD